MSVALYVRVSTRNQAESQTIEQQLERLQAHIQAQGWAVPTAQVFRDDGYSGAVLKRPGLDQLRDQAATAAFDQCSSLLPIDWQENTSIRCF